MLINTVINRTRLFTVVLLLIIPCVSYCQTYQSLAKNKAAFYTSVVLWTGIKSYGWFQKDQILSDPMSIQSASLWKFDRGALRQSSRRSAHMSDGLVGAAFLSPMIVGLLKPNRSQIEEIIYVGLQGFLVENSLNQITKLLTRRPRPGVYLQDEDALRQPLHPNSLRSFYSGHASTASYLAMLAAKIYHDINPDQRAYWPWIAASTLSLATAHFRYQSGKHFPTDILLGTVIGSSLGILVPQILKNKRTGLTVTQRGLGFSYRW